MKGGFLGNFVTRYSVIVIIIILLLTGILGFYMTKIEPETDYSIFMPDDETSRAYQEIMQDYYSAELVNVLAQYEGGNAIDKQSLLEYLEMEKSIIQDELIREYLQRPDAPESNFVSVSNLVIAADIFTKAELATMNATIALEPAILSLNDTFLGIETALRNYNESYAENPTGNDTMRYLNESYLLLRIFLATYEGIDVPQPPDMGVPAMDVDAKIAYLKNMSDEEIHNIFQYGMSITPAKYEEIKSNFTHAAENISDMLLTLTHRTKNIHTLINGSLQTEPVYSNESVSSTFTRSKLAFENISAELLKAHTRLQLLLRPDNTEFHEIFTMALKVILSKDFDYSSATASLMVITLNGTAGNENPERMLQVHKKIKSIVDSFQGSGEYSIVSMWIVSEEMMDSMNSTFTILLPLVFILIIVILYSIYRSFLDTFLGIIGLLMAIVWAYGIGVLLDLSFNVITTTVAILLVGLGVDYAIHTIMRYREEVESGKDVNEAIRSMERKLGVALILSTLTTVIAFLSNLASPIPALQDYGLMNAIGIVSSFIIFITFVPAVKSILDGRRAKKGKKLFKKSVEKSSKHAAKFLSLGSRAAQKKPWFVVLAVILLSLAAFYGAIHIGTEFSGLDFLPENTESYDTIMYLVNNFNASGMQESYVLIKGNITSPTLLKAMDQTLENMVDDRYITFVGTKSIVSVIRTRSALDSNFSLLVSQYDEDGDGLPDSHVKDIYDYLYENDDNARLVLKKEDGSYKSTLIRVKPTSQGNSEHEILYKELKEDIVPLIDAGYYAEVTGGPVAIYVITDSLERSQWNSLLLTLILTMLILAIVFYFLVKSILIGVLTSLPVMIALLWSMGVMYLIGMNFNVLTITITSMTIGLGITYAIHLGHRFVEELKEHSPEKAIERTVMNTGSSIMGAVGTTIGGFGVLILSTMPPMRDFGIIAVMAILLSFILTVFVLPSFLIIWAKRRIKN